MRSVPDPPPPPGAPRGHDRPLVPPRLKRLAAGVAFSAVLATAKLWLCSCPQPSPVDATGNERHTADVEPIERNAPSPTTSLLR